MSLRLYGTAASRTARPLWLLEELGIPYEHVSQTYLGGGTRSPEFLAINPNGHIPVLDDDGVIVWESMAITLYLVRKFGDSPLSPANLAEEAETLRWTLWAVTECEKDTLVVLMHRVVLPAERRDSALAEQAEKRLARPFAILDSHLDGRDYICGARFTVADVNVASVLGWAQASRTLLDANPRVAAWLERCLARPAQKKVRQLAKAGR